MSKFSDGYLHNRYLFTIGLLLLYLSTYATVIAQPAGTTASSLPIKSCSEKLPQKIELGQTLEPALAGGECHSYQIKISAHQFLQVMVEQQGIDVVLTILDRNSTKVSEVDRPNGSRGTETISIIAPTDGLYLLNIRSLESISARGTYKLSIATVRSATERDTTQIAAEQLVSQGEILRATGTAESFRNAIEKFQRAAVVWHSLESAYEEAIALYGAGISNYSLGNNQAGIDYLKQALVIFVELKNTPGEAIARAGLGWPYLYLSDLENSFKCFKEALYLHRMQGNTRGEAIALYGMGWVHALRGENEQALQSFSGSLEGRRRALDRRGEALTLTGIGKIEGRLGNYAAAIKNFDLALSVLPKAERYAEADILSNQGWAYCAQNENRKAQALFSRALELRRQVGDLIGEATTLYGVSIVNRRLGQFGEAEDAIEQTIEIIESLRTKGANQQLRISYFASVQDYYEFYIKLLLELHKQAPSAGYAAKALHACERARARGLLDLLAESKIDVRKGVHPSLLERERTTHEKLSAAAARQRACVHCKDNKAQLQALANETRELGAELEEIRAEIRQQNPAYADLTQPRPLSAEQIQKEVLDDESLVLQYVLGEDQSYLLAVSSREIATYVLPARAQIEQLARNFYDAATTRNRLEDLDSAAEMKRLKVVQADADAQRAMKELSRILLEPAADKLGNRRLIVLAPGVLKLIPFAALPVPAPGHLRMKQSRAGSEPEFLIDAHEIVVLPSLTTMSIIRQQARSRPVWPKTVLVFADPVFDDRDARLGVNIESSRDSANGSGAVPTKVAGNDDTKFSRLTSSRWEGKKIVTIADEGQGKLLLDTEASRAFALSSEPAKYRFVHFATHALIDNRQPELSGILLSMVDEKGRPEDGFLHLHDIFNLKLPVDLVVLSGCRTALGADYAGEGFVGLTRGFMYAGAARVVVSLWEVADKPTSELMVRFYEYMLGPKRLAPAAALRAAQLDLKKDPRWQSPYFWAPFVLQGEWR